MSDFNADNAPVGSEPEQGDVNWEERYRSEVQDRIRERERYKPIKQVFDQMHPDDAAAVQGFAQAWASGDTDAAVQWMIENAKTLAGERFDEIAGVNSRGQTVSDVYNEAQYEGRQAGLDPSQVQEMIDERMQQFQYEQTVAHYEQEIAQTLSEAGYDPESPLAIAAIAAAQQRPDLDLKAAIADIESQIMGQAQMLAQKRVNPSAGMPNGIPRGVPGVQESAMSPRERAMARLEQQGLS